MNMRKLSAIALTAAFVVAACGGGGTGGGATPSASATANAAANIPDTLKIGAVLPLSGADAKTGQYINDAYVLYTKQVNDKGGLTIAGKKVKLDLRIEDNKDDGATSAQLYEKLITQDNVDFLLGGYNTALVTQEIKVANRYKIPYVNGGGASAASYVDNTWAFGLLATIQGLSHTQLDFLTTQQDAGKLPKPLKLAIVYENSSHGKEFSDGLKDGDAARFKIVLNEPFDLNGKDFTSLLQKVKDAGADAFMADAHLPDFITMQRQYSQLGMHHLYITYGARGPDQSAKDQLGAATDYITSAVWFDQQQPGDAVKAWVDMWKANTKDSPEWYAASGWETARILYAALEKTGSVDKDKVRQTLADTTWSGSIFPGGSIKFDKTGQATNSYVMTQNLPGGKTILIWPKDQATGTPIMPVPTK
jgi:branched-chain amino acid transport system substrate-binding protein